MGKPTAQNNSFINHFSHPHPLQLIPPISSPPCSACKLTGGNGRVYSCRPCNFSLHESCSKMKQVISHPSHSSHTLTLLVAPVYDGGYFNCDGCGVNGTGFSYQCSLCDFDVHALCAYKPLSIEHKSHPQHSLKLAFHSPYGADKGFSCDICLKIGKNQWLYRCIPCEFDAHIGCINAHHPHLLPHSSSAPTPLAHHAGHPHHPMPNQGNNRLRPGHMNRPGNNPTRPNRPVCHPGRPMGQNAAVYGPRRQNNNLGYNGRIGPITASDVIGQAVGQSFDQGSMEGSVFDGSAVDEEFDGEVDVEIDYEANGYDGNEDGEAYNEEQDVDGNDLEIVAYGDTNDVAYSESEFGGSSDARSQSNDLSEPADLYPLSVRTNRGPGGGRKQNSSPNSSASARSKNMGRNGRGGRLQGPKNPIENPRGRQIRRLPNNAIRAGGPSRPRDLAAFNGPQGFNGPSGGPSNVTDNGGYNDNYNEVDGNEMYAGEYGDTYGDEGDCDFEAGGDFVDGGYDDQAYDENDFECYSDITGGSESMYNEDEYYDETMDNSQYSGLNDGPNNQFSSMVEPGGRQGMNDQNQYGQTDRPRRMGRYGRGGTQPRNMGRPVQRRPNGGSNRPNGPNRTTVMNAVVQGLCQGLANNMLTGDVNDVNSGVDDSGGLSGMGDMLGGELDFGF